MVSPAGARSDWDWIVSSQDEPLGLTGCVTFVRGVTERAVFEGFEMDPDSARTLTAEEARLDPVLCRATDDGPFWVRVARVGEWCAAIELFQLSGYLDNIASRLSTGTESLAIAVTAKESGVVNYFVDGVWTTSFELGVGYDSRGGREPNRFREPLRAAGLTRLAGGEDHDLTLHQEIIAVLTMFTKTLGIRLPLETFHGPLPTAYRNQHYHYRLS